MIPIPAALIRPLIYLSVAGGLFFSGWWIGRDGAQDKAREAALLANAKAEDVRRATEDAWQVAHWKLAYAAEEQRIAREQATEDTIAGLRDGSLRVRDRFKCPSVPKAPTIAGQPPAEEPGFRAEDAAVAIGIADEADTIADERNQCISSYEALRVKP
ncbi:MAG TPA: hypothetical protein VM512_14080 [Burkholderiaceae bacterium]|jgi:hypothetical protein|nr:hypothetical protein [Burkholderiaceae bacterium]